MPDQPQHPPDESSSPKQAGEEDTYDLLPLDPAPPPPPLAPGNSLKDSGPRFIDTVDDDDDITAQGPEFGDEGIPRRPGDLPEGRPSALVDSAGPDAGILALVATGMTLGGALAAAFFAMDGRRFPEAVGFILHVGIHTVTGVVALGAVALLLGKAFGDFIFAFARMLCVVSALMVGVMIDLPVAGRYVEPLVGAGVYCLAMYLLFRRPWREVGKVAMFHFLIGMLVEAVLLVFLWTNKGRGT